jgi:hypothetical protein
MGRLGDIENAAAGSTIDGPVQKLAAAKEAAANYRTF